MRRAARLSGLDGEAAGAAADELAAVGLLSRARPLRFAHPIMRSTLLSQLPPATASGRHGSAARLLDEEHARADHVAAHLVRVEPAGDAWATERLIEAAELALSSGAPEPAIAYLDRALAEPPADSAHARVLHCLGLARARAGSGDPVAPLQEAVTRATAPAQRAQISIALPRRSSGRCAPTRRSTCSSGRSTSCPPRSASSPCASRASVTSRAPAA